MSLDHSDLPISVGFFAGAPSVNPQLIVLVVVLVIETSQVEHENEDDDNPQSRSAESIPSLFWVERGQEHPLRPADTFVSPPGSHRSTLDPDRGYYGETPVGLAGGSGAGLEE
jgi:hypothetical protein